LKDEKEIQAKAEAFERRVKYVSLELLLEGMLPEDIEKEARQRVATEFRETELRIREGILHVMTVCFYLDGMHKWVMIGQIHGRFVSEYPSIIATQNDVQQVIFEFVNKGVFERGLFDGSKEKFRFRSNEPAKPQVSNANYIRAPIDPNDMADW
jgi:hypothetical protein